MRNLRWLAHCVVVTMGLCISITVSAAQDRLATDARNVPASVHEVTSGGYWSNASSEGFFRTVVIAAGVEQTVHRLYVQWIAVSGETQDHQLSHMVDVDEFNVGHGVTLAVKNDFSVLDQLTGSVEATPLGGGEVQSYVLTATNHGTYQLTPQ